MAGIVAQHINQLLHGQLIEGHLVNFDGVGHGIGQEPELFRRLFQRLAFIIPSSKFTLSSERQTDMLFPVERVVHKAKGFEAAAEWDIDQQIRMTPQERWAIARQLKERVYGRRTKDVRACPHPN